MGRSVVAGELAQLHAGARVLGVAHGVDDPAVDDRGLVPRTGAVELPELVFPGEQGEHFSRSSYARALDLASKAAEINKHVHPHMTRHTFASHLVAKGVHAHIIRAWGGWQSDAMLSRYAHLAPREIRHLIDRIAPGGAALRVINGGEAETTPSREDRGGYTGGYTPSASSKKARTRG